MAQDLLGLSHRLSQKSIEHQHDDYKGITAWDLERTYNEARPGVQKLLQSLPASELANYKEERIKAKIQSLINRHIDDITPKGVVINQIIKRQAIEKLISELLGYGPLESFFDDPMVNEVTVHDWRTITVESAGKRTRLKEGFRNEEHCREVLDRILSPTGRKIDLANPRVDARLPDGSRLKAHIPPLAVKGSTMSIRRFRQDLDIKKYIEYQTLNEELAEFLIKCIKGRLNLIVSGGTGTGKTTFLNVLSAYIDNWEYLITVEDPAELQLKQFDDDGKLIDRELVRSMEARPAGVDGNVGVSMRELVKDALRMYPDRILLGEMRGGEAFDVLTAMNTGHDGSLSTCHSNSTRDAMYRISNMVLMADLGLPYDAILNQMASALQIVVQIERKGRIRRVSEISQVIGVGAAEDDTFKVDKEVKSEKLYQWNGSTWERTKNQFKFAQLLKDRGIEAPEGGW